MRRRKALIAFSDGMRMPTHLPIRRPRRVEKGREGRGPTTHQSASRASRGHPLHRARQHPKESSGIRPMTCDGGHDLGAAAFGPRSRRSNALFPPERRRGSGRSAVGEFNDPNGPSGCAWRTCIHRIPALFPAMRFVIDAKPRLHERHLMNGTTHFVDARVAVQRVQHQPPVLTRRRFDRRDIR
jgi:hypothetical protein